MEYQIKAKDGAFPCEVTIDEDNGRYMVRKADTSGEVFHNKQELINWVKTNWESSQFENPGSFQDLMSELTTISMQD
ncbi:hypothetical protein [Evansella clarkii]|jgi:hypothetical protein|uniref:hypothetical protein n=1 Tax=Evansella clarkii TaxID=79879 RepID=UPI00099618A7|nr:hypothetical protein [Evansella clarkii]